MTMTQIFRLIRQDKYRSHTAYGFLHICIADLATLCYDIIPKKMNVSHIKMNMAYTKMTKPLYFMNMATKMTLPKTYFGFVVYSCGNLITYVRVIVFVVFTFPLSILDMS